MSPAQLSIIKAWIVANNSGIFDQSAVNLLNVVASPDYWVWNTKAVVEAAYNATTWKNFTPIDLPPTAIVPASPTPGETYALSLWTARVLLCQSKQINFQTIFFGRTNLDATNAATRTGIKDAVQDLPAGAAGALVDAGWVPIRNSMERLARLAEKLLVVSGTGTQSDAGTMGFDGLVTLQNVVDSESAA